ncbi:DUF1275 domain protein [Aspergillus granulosus]|uniref:DUF1275 domain protein n=1 Tax=Aspergillus granulosus TaxID=176169 RepID=A0ABR4HER5_9EURO
MARPSQNETSPLLGHGARHASSSSTLDRLTTHLTTQISPQHADLLLLLCYTITGLLDSSAVFIWGSFVSMQTGNTVYLGLGISGLDQSGNQRWLKSLISISSFCLGSFMFALLHHTRFFFRSPRQRVALFLSFILQMLCVVVAATIVALEEQSKTDPLSWKIAAPLALVAFQSSGQAVTSRVVGYSSLTSVVLTSIYCDLFSYPALAISGGGGKRVDEWRRLGAVLALFGGILLGGAWAKSEVGLQGALWTAVVLKGVIAGAWLVWRGEEDEEVY